MALSAGDRLGAYEITLLRGAGGQGEVYKARDTRLARIVAVKVLPSHLATNPQLRERFEREARTAGSLNHPHICALYDIGRQETPKGPVDFMVMEYIDGVTLAEWLEKGPLPLDEALRYGIQAADALDKAHRAGVVHRDYKPGNIINTKLGPKITDYGLANFGAAAQGGLDLSPYRRLRSLSRSRARSWGRSSTWLRSSSKGRTRTPGRTSGPLGWCCTRCSP